MINRANFGVVLILTASLLVSTTGVLAQSTAQEADIDVTFDLQSNGRLQYLVEISSESSDKPLPTSGLSEGGVSINISSPSSGELEAEASASLTFDEENLSDQVELALNMLSPDMINNGIPGSGFPGLHSFEGQYLRDISFAPELGLGLEGSDLPPNLSDLKIKELSCVDYEWSKPQFEIGFVAGLSGTIFENERIRSELPLNIEASLNDSGSSSNLSLSLDSPNSEMSLDFSSTVPDSIYTIEMTIEGQVGLPTSDGTVQWDFGLPGTSAGLSSSVFSKFAEQLPQGDVSFTLEVPSGASVSGLPSGFQQEGDTYTWEGNDAEGVVSSVLSGDTETQISYEASTSGTGFPAIWIGVGVALVASLIVFLVFFRIR